MLATTLAAVGGADSHRAPRGVANASARSRFLSLSATLREGDAGTAMFGVAGCCWIFRFLGDVEAKALLVEGTRRGEGTGLRGEGRAGRTFTGGDRIAADDLPEAAVAPELTGARARGVASMGTFLDTTTGLTVFTLTRAGIVFR